MIQYIAGFFDADGSVGLYDHNTKTAQSNTKEFCISFSNCKKPILEEIKKYLQDDYGIKTILTEKKKQKEHHQTPYELKAIGSHGRELGRILQWESRHPNKKDKINLYLDLIVPLIKRNGKYSDKEKEKLKQLEIAFNKIGC